jgi:hypothetical protein
MPARNDIADFIRATFPSVWALELLCFLRQKDGNSLSRADMVAGLRGSELVITQSVDSLVRAGLVATDPDGAARYAPANARLAELAAQVEALYAKSPDAVRRLIVSAASPSLTAFVDAFRFRKDRDDD